MVTSPGSCRHGRSSSFRSSADFCYFSSVPRPTNDALIENLRAFFATESGVRLAVLFGSVARHEAQPGSDIDIAVDAPGMDLLSLAARLSERFDTEVDLVALPTDSIPLMEQLIADGIVLHESERGRAADFRFRLLSQLETDRPWYRRMRDAWLTRVAREGLGNGR